jgi:hypothetical protein
LVVIVEADKVDVYIFIVLTVDGLIVDILILSDGASKPLLDVIKTRLFGTGISYSSRTNVLLFELVR